MLTAKDVAAVLGPIDEAKAAEIVATEATIEELTQAWAWVKQR